MIYISYGVPKSASTFTYVVTEQVLKTAGYELATVSDAVKGRRSRLNYIDPIAWHTIENVAAEIGVQSAIIKTHGAPDKCLLEAVERRGVFASAVIRDPRDIALSLLDHARRSRELGGGDFAELETVADTFSVIDEQIDRLQRWMQCSKVLLLTYDEISFNTEMAIRRIIAQLGLSVSAASVILALPPRARIEQFNKGIGMRHELEMPAATQQIFLDRYEEVYRNYLACAHGIPKVRAANHAATAPTEPWRRRVETMEQAASGSAMVEGAAVNDSAPERPQDRRESPAITRAAADRLRWFHSIDLGDGIITKGRKSLESIQRNAEIAFKDGVDGRTVLDIGAWDGAFSFEAERRGAAHILAIDHFSWVGPGWGRKESFDFARMALASRVEAKIIDVPDISPDTVGGRFDIVLFLGVLYHMLHPLLMLERIAPVVSELLVVETETALDDEDRPAMVFFPGAELNNDATNWWAPNITCMKAMLQHVGFTRIEVSPTWGYNGKVTHRRGRFTFHAWK